MRKWSRENGLKGDTGAIVEDCSRVSMCEGSKYAEVAVLRFAKLLLLVEVKRDTVMLR